VRIYEIYSIYKVFNIHNAGWDEFSDEAVPFITAWRVLTLRMEERPPILRVAVNILNKQSRTVENE
jgi:hypothetical protein